MWSSDEPTCCRTKGRGRTLVRFRRRIERLRQHHNDCERRMRRASEQVDDVDQELGSDSTGAEFSCPTGSDLEYNPESSSSDEDLEIPEKSSSWKESSIDESLNLSSSREDDQKRGKYTRTYGKTKSKKQKTNKDEVKTVTIKTCTKREDGKRSWDKKHYCPYCAQSNAKMARHLMRKHMDIKYVAYAFSFSVRSKERKVLLEQLRNKGDFKHNAKVLEKGAGQLVTWKQPSHEASVEDYLPCTYCYGMFVKKDLWKHQSSCKSKKLCVTDNETNKRQRVQSLAAHLLPIAASSSGCQKVINNMRQDDVSFHIRSDALICMYGDSLYAKHGRVKSRHQYISQRMRVLGRFMLAAKDMDRTVKGLEDLCVPSKFQFVVSVAKRIKEFSPGKNEYGKPSTAVKIGFCLKGAVEVLIGQTLMNDDDLVERKAKKFLELLEKNWKNHVSVSAHQTIQEKRWNKQDDIRLTKNVVTLRDHLRMVEDKAKEELTQEPSLTAYKMLNETVLAQVIIFNKRREGEASRLTLDTYKTASTNPINEDIYETLSPLEKELSKLLTRIEVRGKRGRKVPVFLTKRMQESINLLIERRDEAGIPAENPYLFARPGAMTNIRGCDCLRKYAEESKAENPELLRSTKLRKQVATLCQLLDLSEQELEQVARFMGHDIRVHRDFYRQTDKTFQIAKISKLLFAMEQGTGTLKGKNLSTIDISVCDEIPTSSSDIVPQNEKNPGREEDDDGCSHLSPLRKRLRPCDEDGSSDVDVEIPTSSSVPQKAEKGAREVDDDGFSDLFSPRKKSAPCFEDDRSPGESPSVRPTQKKRQKQKKAEKEKDGGFDFCPEKTLDQSSEDGNSNTDEKRLSQKKMKKKVKDKELPKVTARRPWTKEEKEAIHKHLKKNIKELRVPCKEDRMRAKNAEAALSQRSWKDIKNFVYNAIVTFNRRSAMRKLEY